MGVCLSAGVPQKLANSAMIARDRADALLADATKLRLAVVGDVMLDHYIWGDVERISPEAPVPIVDVERDTYVAGGAANVAVNLASLGAQAELCGRVGRDDGGARLVSLFGDRGVRFNRSAFVSAACPTIEKTRVVVRGQQLCRLDREGAPHAYALGRGRALAAVVAAVRRSRAVILSDYAKGVLDDALVRDVVAAARDVGALVAVDAKPKRRLAIEGADLLKCNRRESVLLAGLSAEHGAPWPAAEICRRIHERYHPAHLVITLGADGMLVSAGGKVVRTIPTAAREVFDVSGAGDTAIAAITMALAAGAGILEAVEFGNAASGVVVAKLGTATVTPAELRRHLER